jgi:hypothetical protein
MVFVNCVQRNGLLEYTDWIGYSRGRTIASQRKRLSSLFWSLGVGKEFCHLCLEFKADSCFSSCWRSLYQEIGIMKHTTILLLTIKVGTHVACAQGTFQNLDFEQAAIVPTGPGIFPLVEAAPALPHWTAYLGSTPLSIIVYNSISIGSPMVSIHDVMSPVVSTIQGSYSVALQHSVGGTPTTAAIGQTGSLPADAMSLVFSASPISSLTSLEQLQVTFAGNPISIFELGSTPGYSLVGADISAYAGLTGELRFTALPTCGAFVLDRIQFSAQPVPEPSTCALLGLGASALAVHSWRRKCRHGERI